ncbi:MAG: phage regulatory CII family protein [Formivibrio sp.]|nr:phage regulatory CII family protein [Formivibrio sp.]
MNLADAAHATVYDYPGGAESLAPRLGMGAQVLRNKVNPNGDRNVLGLQEASRLMMVTRDYRLLQAICLEQNFAAVPLVDGPIGDVKILELITRIWKEIGDLGCVTQEVLADHKVTHAEVGRFKEEVQLVVAAVMSLQFALEALEE